MFAEDLNRTFRAWRDQPLLPLSVIGFDLAVGFAAAFAFVFSLRSSDPFDPDPGIWILPFLVVAGGLVLLAGFLGAQRVWYARLFAGRPVSPGQVAAATGRLTGPFLVLGLLAAMVWGAVVLPFWSGPRWFGMFLATAVVDVLFTFATSAVAVGGESPGSAVATSWRMIRAGWPRCAAHVLLPPLVLFSLPGRSFPLLILSELVAIAARGVTTSYYLRVTEAAAYRPSEYAATRDPALYG